MRLFLFIALLTLSACAAPAAPTATPEPPATVPPTAPPPLPSPTLTAAPTLAPSATTAPLPSSTPAPQATASPSPTPDLAAQAIFNYLAARAKTDLDATLALSCAAWDSQAAVEVTSFRSMNAVLEEVTCAANGQAGDFTLVTCGGKMITTYGGESREWDLSSFVYQAVLEDGQWMMCGYH
jgi:hypothetical protein